MNADLQSHKSVHAVELKGLSKAFGSVRALGEVTLSVRPAHWWPSSDRVGRARAPYSGSLPVSSRKIVAPSTCSVI